ncbi:MAG: heme-binding protein, partial [Fluviibacter sp.]
NSAIKIREVPSKTYAVVRYSGLNTEHRINQETQRLFAWIDNHNLVAAGTPELARYNPPWTLPMFRRNEILIATSNKK